MTRRLLACLLFLLIAGLASCGQKGPLYLPVTPPRTIPTMPQAATHAPATTTRPAPTAVTYPVSAAVKPY